MSTSITTTTPSSAATKTMSDDPQSQSSRYQQLKQRKEALEKKLNEKYEQLHQLCQKEASLIGNNLDLISGPSSSSQNTLRKRVGGDFKPPESQTQSQDDINKLLLQRQMQQQISMASYRIANDPLQSKSIRRTHKLTYETSQQKISQLSESISRLQRQRPLSQDDIDLHRNESRHVRNTLAMVGNNPKNLHILNANNPMSERRNSMKSTTSSLGSSNTFIVQASPSSASSLTSLKTLPNNGSLSMNSPKLRHDSATRFDYEFHRKNESPTPSNFSLQSPQNIVHHQQHLPLCTQSLKNIKINTGDTLSISSQDFYNNFSNQHSPYANGQPQYPNVSQPHLSPQGRNQMHPNENKFIHRLHSFHQQYQHDMQQRHLMTSAREVVQDDLRMRQIQKSQIITNHHSPNHYTPAHSAGLGGFWTINELNQRVWVSDSKYPISPPPATNMSKKSNSLGNFDFMHKHEVEQQHDSVSVSSGNSNEHKKKEKVWSETSLDQPVTPEPPKYPQQLRPRVESPVSSDVINNNHQYYESLHSPTKSNVQSVISSHYQTQSINNNNFSSNSNGHLKVHKESIYLNPLANANLNTNPPPNIPPKSKLRYSESTRSTMSNRDIENNIIQQHVTSPIQLESPKNVTVIQEGSWQPYKEEIKSYEISDFYKYSQKYRQQQQLHQKHNEC